MPEGPEVKRIAEALSKLEGKTITKGLVVSGRYLRGAIHGLDSIVGMRLDRVAVKGKLITFYLRGGEPRAILSTLGMSGWWTVFDKQEPAFDAHRRIEIEFDDGTVAAFFDPRNFGTFKVVSHAEAKRKQAELGPDILTPEKLWDMAAVPEFITRAKRFSKDQTVAEALLDQRICSGCGNYIRADAMYLARLSPHRRMSELSEVELRKIWAAMHKIAAESESVEEYKPLVYGQKQTPTGGTVESFSDNTGRTVWWSPKEQA